MAEQQPTPSSPTVKKASFVRLILTLTLVAILSGLIVVSVYLSTRPIIEENKRLAIEAAVLTVIPDAQSYLPFAIIEGQLTPAIATQRNTQLFYAGYDKDRKLIGFAAPANSQGYADKVYLIYGYRFDCECITGIKVIKHAETPGLGDKIITDKDFVANFEALDAKLNKVRSGLQNNIITVKHGNKKKPWEIDAVTGATITSRAVGRALNASAGILLPQVVHFSEKLKQNQP